MELTSAIECMLELEIISALKFVIDIWVVESLDSMETGLASLKDTCSGSFRVENSDSKKYLGDIICKDGRKGRVLGFKNQILNMLNYDCFGPFNFEVALIFRSSLLTSSIL